MASAELLGGRYIYALVPKLARPLQGGNALALDCDVFICASWRALPLLYSVEWARHPNHRAQRARVRCCTTVGARLMCVVAIVWLGQNEVRSLMFWFSTRFAGMSAFYFLGCCVISLASAIELASLWYILGPGRTTQGDTKSRRPNCPYRLWFWLRLLPPLTLSPPYLSSFLFRLETKGTSPLTCLLRRHNMRHGPESPTNIYLFSYFFRSISYP